MPRRAVLPRLMPRAFSTGPPRHACQAIYRLLASGIHETFMFDIRHIVASSCMRFYAFSSILTLCAAAAVLPAQATKTKSSTPKVTVGVAGDKVGGEPTKFLPVVGHWVVALDEGRKVVMVDGREWKRGQPAG